MSSLLIRQAVPADHAAVAELAERTFRDTFARDNDPADMDAYVRRSFGRDKVRSEIGDPSNLFLLAVSESEGPLIGYVRLTDGEPNRVVQGSKPVELERLYVRREAIGKGVGAALMQAGLDEAAARGFETIWLGVWERNERAIAFYRRWAFEAVGSHTFLLGSDEQTDLIMQRPVGIEPSEADR